jgi:hypothetical protein
MVQHDMLIQCIGIQALHLHTNFIEWRQPAP